MSSLNGVIILWFCNLASVFASDMQGVLGQRRGVQLLQYQRRAHVWTQYESLGIDQYVETTPPGTKVFDRRVTNYFALGQESLVGTGGVRTALEFFHQVTKIEEEVAPKSPVERTVSTADIGVDYTFVNPKGLEIALGIQGRHLPKSEETQTATQSSSQTKLGAASLYSPRVALVKRTGAWNGAFYYRQGSGNQSRSFLKTGSDGTLIEGQSLAYIPSHYGVSGAFEVNPFYFVFDLMAVQAGEGGPESEEGLPVHEDYLDVFIQADMPGFGMSLRHRTLSYSRNAFVSLDRIPYTALAIYGVLGAPPYGLKVGVTGVYADDAQSIPEFNAHYHTQGFGLMVEGFWAI